uniref:(northern house mosquito) hypothetical protein n=1 Tax=Culex pipiens TaxID=7175 RepID=A0A8D8MA97_CULPI
MVPELVPVHHLLLAGCPHLLPYAAAPSSPTSQLGSLSSMSFWTSPSGCRLRTGMIMAPTVARRTWYWSYWLSGLEENHLKLIIFFYKIVRQILTNVRRELTSIN